MSALTRRAPRAILSLAEAWLGIAIAFYSDWPVSFCIALLSALGYFAALAMPAIVAVPLPLSVKVTPVGRVPV